MVSQDTLSHVFMLDVRMFINCLKAGGATYTFGPINV